MPNYLFFGEWPEQLFLVVSDLHADLALLLGGWISFHVVKTLFLLPQLPCSFVHGWFRKNLPIVISDLWFCSVWFLVSLNLSHKLSKFMEKKNYLFSALLRVSLKGPKADESSQSTMMPVQNSVLLIDKIKNSQKLYIHLVILRVHVRSSAALL